MIIASTCLDFKQLKILHPLLPHSSPQTLSDL
jgi:hypothetical protein